MFYSKFTLVQYLQGTHDVLFSTSHCNKENYKNLHKERDRPIFFEHPVAPTVYAALSYRPRPKRQLNKNSPNRLNSCSHGDMMAVEAGVDP